MDLSSRRHWTNTKAISWSQLSGLDFVCCLRWKQYIADAYAIGLNNKALFLSDHDCQLAVEMPVENTYMNNFLFRHFLLRENADCSWCKSELPTKRLKNSRAIPIRQISSSYKLSDAKAKSHDLSKIENLHVQAKLASHRWWWKILWTNADCDRHFFSQCWIKGLPWIHHCAGDIDRDRYRALLAVSGSLRGRLLLDLFCQGTNPWWDEKWRSAAMLGSSLEQED